MISGENAVSKPNEPELKKEEPAKKPEQPKSDKKEKPKTEVPPAEKPPAEKPPAKPEVKPPETKPKPDAKTEPKAPAKPAAPAVPAKKPVSLEGLADGVDLPALGHDATDPVSLGKIQSEPTAKVDIRLVGGEIVAKATTRFDLAIVEGEDGTWYVRNQPKGKEPANVASITRKDNELAIQWLDVPEAKDRSNNYLRLCGLRVACEDKTRFVPLSKPQTKDPLLVDLVAGATKLRLPIKDIQLDPALVRLQIFPLDEKTFFKTDLQVLATKAPEPRTSGTRGPKPSAGKTVEPVPGDTIAAKGQVVATVRKEKTPPIQFRFGLACNGRMVEIGMRSEVELMGQVHLFSLGELRTWNSWLQSVDAAQQAGAKKSKAAAPAGQAEAVKAAKTQIAALDTLLTDLNRKGKVNYRVFVALSKPDDNPSYGVTLFESMHPEPPKPPADKKDAQA